MTANISIKIEQLERRILIKKQLIQWTQEDIKELEEKLKELGDDSSI